MPPFQGGALGHYATLPCSHTMAYLFDFINFLRHDIHTLQKVKEALVAQWIEHQLAELGVVGSNPAGRTRE